MAFCNKIALITGGSKGLGLAMAKELLNQGLKGVMLASRSEKDLQCAAKQLGEDKVKYMKCDVTCFDQLEKVFMQTVNCFDALDIVINNAGTIDEDNWCKVIDLNLKGVIQGTYLALKEYLSANFTGNEGVVVNVASILGLQPMSSLPSYTSTKHVIIGFTRSIGTDYYYENSCCKVVALCPGVTDTEILTKNERFARVIKGMPQQPPECVGTALCDMLTKCPDNGSVWVTEGREPVYEVDFPDFRCNRKVQDKCKTC